MSCSAHWPSGTSTSQASPSHTPTVPAVQVCVCACEFARLPAEAQLLSNHGECQSARVVPVIHTAGLRYCVGTVSSMSVLIAVTPCLCNPRTEVPSEASPARTYSGTSAHHFIRSLPGCEEYVTAPTSRVCCYLALCSARQIESIFNLPPGFIAAGVAALFCPVDWLMGYL